ncbi:hypothetical protein KIH74_32815 [Kineosporia sp. J2-2]|uniref:Secreted protein n=1 Tax=Kineosporia corallincola TaxID=2835133 RepID=A0ABS5TSJ7_9ACTN|nr:hypothetical protein [Kineosporia corallincola]MBT0773774.1 hypothetical protein [Kineosporia corallincola]
MRNTLGAKTIAAVLGAGALAVSSLGLAGTAQASTGGTTVNTAATKGCAANDKTVPKGAARADAGDIDGDGRNDQVWVSDTRKGFRTATGAVYSQKIANAGGPEVGVRALHLNHDVVALIEQGRLTYVTAFADCKLKKTTLKSGATVHFDRGFTSPYRDLGCIGDDDYSELNALTLGHDTTYKKSWSVKQTVVNISANGKKASNGDSTTKRYTTRAKAMKALNGLASGQTCSTEVASQV